MPRKQRTGRLRWLGAPLAAACLCLSQSSAVAAQGVPLWSTDRMFSFYFENDALRGGSDSAYTNGVRIAWDFMAWNTWLTTASGIASLRFLFERDSNSLRFKARDRRCQPEFSRADRPCGTIGFGIGQTMYTPANLFDTLPRPMERPYAGMLFASAWLNTLHHKWQLGSELLAGVIGPWSNAESTQSLAHWTWATTAAKPRGWRNQLRNSFQIGLVNTYAFRVLEWCKVESGCNGSHGERRVFDVTPRGELALGTHMRRASVGGVLRVGRYFPDVIGTSRIPTTAPSATGSPALQFWYYLFFSGDARYVQYNAFLEGTGADNGTGGWKQISQIEPTRGVYEYSSGFGTGWRRGSLTFQLVHRSNEYAGDRSWHKFGALTLSLFTALSAS